MKNEDQADPIGVAKQAAEQKYQYKELVGTFKWQRIMAIGTAFIALFTLGVLYTNYKMVKSSFETSHHILKMVESTRGTMDEAAKMARSIAEMTRANSGVADNTGKVATTTAEIAKAVSQLVKPAITVYCIIQCEFDPEIDDGISFNANAYLQVRSNVRFYIAVKNGWIGHLYGNLQDVLFNVSLEGDDNTMVRSRSFKQDVKLGQLGPWDVSRIREAGALQQGLLNKFNWNGPLQDKTVKITIDRRTMKIFGSVFPGVNVKYFTLEDFEHLNEKYKESRRKKI